MTDDELKKIDDRANAATPGPWSHGRWDDGSLDGCIDSPEGTVLTTDGGLYWRQGLGCYDPEDRPRPDQEFVVHARTDIPALIVEVRRLQELLKKARDYEEHLRSECSKLLARAKDAERSRDEYAERSGEHQAQAGRWMEEAGALRRERDEARARVKELEHQFLPCARCDSDGHSTERHSTCHDG